MDGLGFIFVPIAIGVLVGIILRIHNSRQNEW